MGALNRRSVLSLGLVLLLLATACGDAAPGNDDADGDQGGGAGGKLVVYSGRNENLIRPLIELFTERSGIEVEARYADTTELTATLLEEGAASPADVFFSQDAGALVALEAEGRLAELKEGAAAKVPDRFRDPEDHWTGISGRARTIVFNPEEVAEADRPQDILDVTDPTWKGRVGLAPTNASFISHISALLIEIGEDDVKKFLAELKANDPKIYDSNGLVVKAVAAGEVDLGLVNHYYALNEKKENPGAAVANIYPQEGAFVNLAGVGILEGAKNRGQADEFVEFLLSPEGQEFFRAETNEYPLVEGIAGPEGQPPLAELKTIDLPLDQLGKDLERSAALIKEAGLS